MKCIIFKILIFNSASFPHPSLTAFYTGCFLYAYLKRAMLKSNLGDGCYNYPQKQNVATFHADTNTEIGCVYPWFFLFQWYFSGSFSCFKSSVVLVTFQLWLTPVCCCHH